MTFEVTKREGLARIGKINTDTTPKILKTSDLKKPEEKALPLDTPSEILEIFLDSSIYSTLYGVRYPDIRKRWIERKGNNLYAIGNLIDVLKEPRLFVETILELKKKYLGPLYAPASSLPTFLPVLVYSGIDLFDDVIIRWSSENNLIFFSDGIYRKSEIENSCSCISCEEGDFYGHNLNVMESELEFCRYHIKKGDFRLWLESRIVRNPIAYSIVKLLDIQAYEIIESELPIANSMLYFTTSSALNFPIVKRWRERVFNRFTSEKPVLLLLPCSAKKPYSTSKTHRRIFNLIKKAGNPNFIQEMIVTSPLGLVPREWERIYPAAHYDVSVTRTWDYDERNTIGEMIYQISEGYDEIISFLPEDYKVLCENACERGCEIKFIGSGEELINNIKNMDYDFDESKYDRYRKIIDYQFGTGISQEFVKDNCTIKGRVPRIYFDGELICTLNPKTGFFSLNIAGGEILNNFDRYWVEINTENIVGNSINRPAIEDIHEDVRIGDEVLIRINGRIFGVGRSLASKVDLILQKGAFVKIRHKAG